MNVYSALKLMRANFNLILGASAQLVITPASTSNDAAGKICRTFGDATLADFIVAPRSRSTTTSTSSLREIVSRSQSSIRKAE